jgi:LysM repeat protein
MSQRPPQDPPARRPAPPRPRATDGTGQRRRPPQARQSPPQGGRRPPAAPTSAASPPRTSPRRRPIDDEEDLLLPDEQLEPFRPSKGALIVASLVTVLAVAFLLLQGGSGGGSGEQDLTFEDEVYVTRDGDTLASVSTLLSVDESALADANGLSTSDSLSTGTTLQVPDDPGVTETTPAGVAQVEDSDHLADEMEHWADDYGVEPALLKALAWQESTWDNSAVSEAGAIGIGQLMPETITYVATDLLGEPTLSAENADDNIQMSARYLAYLLELNGGDWGAALASYNQGPTQVRRDGWNAAGTQYVTDVMALTRGFQADEANT